eukprot:TRINITY_DN16467_c0_g1_i2.p1 TRINITY_DN16467_c0_g1~~TRINITY_DN16467_c0_g1_i2.p1  ORF type:complete len:422 (+),score=90.25 TRINITY_DN16467_c0_g1_i2:66-1331(+)
MCIRDRYQYPNIIYREMETSLTNCMVHRRPNEMHCAACNTFLCLECMAAHKTEQHKPRYVHLMQHAMIYTLPQIELLKGFVESSESELESEAKILVKGLSELAPEINETVNLYFQRFEQLKATVKLLRSCAKYTLQNDYKESMKKRLLIEKKQLEKFIKAKDSKELLRLVQKVEEEAKVVKNQETSQDLIVALRKAIVEIKGINMYKSILSSARSLTTKCSLFRLNNYQKDWTCDRRYFSSKMYLSADGLTFGNTASNGYPAIIGTVPFDTGLYAYEVIPIGLDCNEKEGFGIIDRDKYLAAYNKDKITPAVHSQMIGFLYRKDARNMRAVKITDMRMNEKYYVRVNIPELTVTIEGPGVELTATLKAGVAYYPCFSCGCSNNKMKIRPLNSFYEGLAKESCGLMKFALRPVVRIDCIFYI